jgi:hypothetical protein
MPLSLLILGGCVGVQFQDSPTANQPLPNDYTKRTFIDDPHSVRVDLEHHLGSIWLKRAGASPDHYDETIIHVLAAGFTPKSSVPQNPNVFSSQITSKYSANGAYAAFVSAGLSGSQALDFSIADSLDAVIPEDQIPIADINNFLSGADGNLATVLKAAHAGDVIVWTRELTLSTITKKSSGIQDANGTTSLTVFKVDGTLHNESDLTTADYAVGADFRQIATVVSGPGGVLTIDNTAAHKLQATALAAHARILSLGLAAVPVAHPNSDFPGHATAVWVDK